MSNIIKNRQTKTVFGQRYGEVTTLTKPLAERIISNAEATLSVVSYMIGGWVMLGQEGEEKPHHIILKEIYKPHEPANSITLKIVNGSAYVFKWKWQWLGVCDSFNIMSCYAISKSSTTTTTNDDKQSVAHLQNAFIHIIWPHDEDQYWVWVLFKPTCIQLACVFECNSSVPYCTKIKSKIYTE